MSFDYKRSCFALHQNTTERSVNPTDRCLLVQLCIFITIVIFKAKQGQILESSKVGAFEEDNLTIDGRKRDEINVGRGKKVW